jgi:NodT family efflux transporter outer membrane factor (OMF) lipoprotein
MTRRLSLAVLLLGLTGCAVGPDFKAPDKPTATRYTQEPLPPETTAAGIGGGAAQRFVQGMDTPRQWWTLFHSDALNRLIDAALKANPDVQAAQASLRAAQEAVYIARAPFAPSVGAQLSSSRGRVAGGIGSPIDSDSSFYKFHTAQVSVSYLPDLFGGKLRAVESAQAQMMAQRHQLDATYLSLIANVVNAAIQEASLRAQLDATQQLAAIGSDILGLMRKQYGLGEIAYADVVAQEQAVAQMRADVPGLRKQLAQQRNLLATLLGRTPDDLLPETFELDALTLPQELPLSLPSRLVEQRPDIAAATELLHAASAEVGVATANMLPQINLSATLGSQALGLRSLFGPGSAMWDLTGSVMQTLFAGGALLHQKRAAEANLEAAAAQYRSTVLHAFQEVADTLEAIKFDSDALGFQLTAQQAAAQSLKISQDSLRLGASSYLAVLNAQQTLLQSTLALAQARASRFGNTVALFQALGGGVSGGESAAMMTGAP